MEIGLLLAEARRLLAERRRARIRGGLMLAAYATAMIACGLARGPSPARALTTLLAVVAFGVALRELRAVRRMTARLCDLAVVLALTRTRGSA